MKHRLFAPAVAAGSALLTGCALGPNLPAPPGTAPVAWKETAVASSGDTPSVVLPSSWWTIFHDPDLDRLEAQVAAANQDLQRAAARVAEARALARLNAADFYPDIAIDAANSRGRTSASRATGAGQETVARDHALQVGLSYEVDFWGRARQANAAALADARATAEDYHALRLLLTAEAAQHYWQLRSLDAEKMVLEATLALRRDTVGLQETRQRAGLINEMDLTRARSELGGIEAELSAVIRQRARTEHALAVLSGQPPASFAIVARPAAFPAPEIPAGLPSTLLQRRPDLAAAQHELEAAGARVGVAKADFFPRLSLTGAAGFASADLGRLLDGDSHTWSLGSALHLPLFDGGRNRANLAAAEARFSQATATYHGVVLNAFREVEDALSDISGLTTQRAAVERSLLAARDTVGLATERYQRGLANYLDVIDAQRFALQTERLTLQLDGQRTIAIALLAKALGGGWEPSDRLVAR